MKRLYIMRNHGPCIWSRFWEIGNERWKALKICVFSKFLFEKNHEAEFFLKFCLDENVANDSAQLLAWAKVFRISFQFWEKSVTNYEKMGKFSNFSIIPLFAQKNQSEKISTSFLASNVVYWTLVQITKLWTAYFFSVLRYRSSSINK